MTRAGVIRRLRTAEGQQQPVTLSPADLTALLGVRTEMRKTSAFEGWTSGNLEAARTYALQGLRAGEIGFILGCTAGAVHHAMRRSPPTLQACHDEWRMANGARAHAMWMDGTRWSQIALQLGVSVLTAQNHHMHYRKQAAK